MPADIHSVTFKDLGTLSRVYWSRSFTRMAEELDVNQSAVSYTIDKLRKRFGDPLFVRLGGGIAHTERCTEIVNAARELLRNFETIALPRSFDPFTVTGRVTIACNYLERVLILPKIVRTVRETAPGLAMAIMLSSGRGDAQLKTAEASFLLGPMVPMDTGFHSQKLFDEHYVCVMDRDNPLARAPLSRRSYLACNHALITYGGSWRSGFRTELEELGLELNNVLLLNGPSGLADILVQTDLVSTVPSRLAARLGDQVISVSSPFPAPFEIHLVWTERTHKSALHSWLRKVILGRSQARHNLYTEHIIGAEHHSDN